MKQFCIAHLSDLHIGPNQPPAIERVRDNLIRDLKTLVDKNKLILDSIAITGDIVDHGGSEEHYNLATIYIKKLFSSVNLPLDRIAIVPGNHDAPRRNILTDLVKKTTIEEYSKQNKKDFEEIWETFDARNKLYYKFVNDLVPANCEYVFGAGVKNIQVASGAKVQFLLLNSSWLTTGSLDYGNIGIGHWQLEGVKKLKEKSDKPDLTLALFHHPVNWFNVQDKNDVLTFIREKNLLGVNAVLHGHIHDGGIDINTNPDGSILSLISGIGYPVEKGIPKPSRCRYALYKFNIDDGNVEIWLRHTDDNGSFAADTLLYKAAKEDGRLKIAYKSVKTTNFEDEICNSVPMEVDAIPIVSGWVGRSEELKRLLTPETKLIAITGVGGQGKTALASEFLRRFARGENSKFQHALWVNCRELPDTLHTKIISLLEALSGGKESASLYRDEKLEDTIKRFLIHLQQHRSLIIFDNIDAYVEGDTEAPLWELKPIMDMILNNQHESLVILTCREPLNHPSSCFRHIQLQGLNIEDGVELFRKREISLINKNNVDYCEKLVALVNGHPWWLGLIAGQVQSGKDTLKNCVEKYSLSEITPRGRIKEYFESVWKQLNKQRKKILRHLVESSRPLTIAEIIQAIDDSGYATVQKEVRRLIRIGLLEPHEDTISKDTIFYVHPLVREFVHETYTVAMQKQYVFRVLKIFLPNEILHVLNKNLIELGKLRGTTLSLNNLIDSIETCLNSRNLVEALALLKNFQSLIINGGRVHSFCSLTCQALDAVNWDQILLLTTQDGVKLVQNNIDLLAMTGDLQRAGFYLKMYDSCYERNTAAHLGYLLVAAHYCWVKGEFQEASRILKLYDKLDKKLSLKPWTNQDVQSIRGLIIRDSGDFVSALQLFRRDKPDGVPTAADDGNMARCFQKMEKFKEAENLLRSSLVKLKKETSYLSRSNIGYAYQWIAELYAARDEIRRAKAFAFLVRVTWAECAPGLLWRLKKIEDELFKDECSQFDYTEAKNIESEFLSYESNNY